jgi:hypothetical protein
MLKSLVVIVIAMLARLASLVSLLAIFLALMTLLPFLLLMSLLPFFAGLMIRPVVGIVTASISAAIPACVVRFVVVSGTGVIAPSVSAAVVVGT